MSELTIFLPYSLKCETLRTVISTFIASCGDTLPDAVLIDFKHLGFIEPAGVTFLSNFIHWLLHNSVKCSFINHDTAARSLAFLDDSLFFKQHLGYKLNEFRNPRSTTQILRRVGHHESHAFIQQTLTPWIASAIHVNHASIYPFQNCLSEIFNNIQDHTDRDNGSIFAQHFPNMNRVKIAIADFGKGIPANVATVLPDLTHNEAIIKATEAGFSTKSTPRNRGIGLDYLLQTVVCTNGGSVTICSFDGMVRFTPWEKSYQAIPSTYPGFCPGTTIDIELRTDTIALVDDEPEDLVW